jgi:hypothetical protein
VRQVEKFPITPAFSVLPGYAMQFLSRSGKNEPAEVTAVPDRRYADVTFDNLA